MTQTEDITIERTQTGRPAYIKFNFEKYGNLLYAFCLEHGLTIPIDNIPNEVTAKALEEAHQGIGKRFANTKELFADLYS